MPIDYSKYPPNWKTEIRPENLAALCQKCHLAHDAGQHKATRQKNRFRNQPELWEE